MKPLLLVVMLCALLLRVGIADAQDGNPCYIKGGTMVNGQCVLNGDVTVSIEYPIDLAQNPFVAATIDPFIKATKDDFITRLAPDFQAHGGVLRTTYNEYHHSDSIASLVFLTYEGYGFQVHGLATFQTFTFDLHANKLLGLNDLFLPQTDYMKVLAPTLEMALINKFGDFYEHRPVSDNPGNLQAFALDQDALVFFFGDYELGCYCLGQQNISIPLSLLTSVLKPEFAA